jgi:ParB-like chromosome segregation protein Spo0J
LQDDLHQDNDASGGIEVETCVPGRPRCDTVYGKREGCPPNFDILPLEKLKTNYAKLRPGRAKPQPDLSPLPIRVVPVGGHYEVLDGFKRLASWREQGYRQIPVVIEAEGRPEDHKRLILLANAPSRTLTALDEAKVVADLQQDGLSESSIAHFLQKTPKWVEDRTIINGRLGQHGKEKLASSAIGPSTALALCKLLEEDQQVVLVAAEKHALPAKATVALCEAYRVADEPDRKQLLRDPKGALEPMPSVAQSSLAIALERRLEQIRRSLVNLTCFRIPSELAPPEQRRIEAVLRSVLDLLQQTVRAVLPIRTDEREDVHEGRYTNKEEAHRRFRRHPSVDPRAARQGLRDAEDQPQSRMLPQDRTPRPP